MSGPRSVPIRSVDPVPCGHSWTTTSDRAGVVTHTCDEAGAHSVHRCGLCTRGTPVLRPQPPAAAAETPGPAPAGRSGHSEVASPTQPRTPDPVERAVADHDPHGALRGRTMPRGAS